MALSHKIMFFLSRLTSQKRLLVVNNISLDVTSTTQEIASNVNLLAYRYKGGNIDKKEEQVEQQVVEQPVI